MNQSLSVLKELDSLLITTTYADSFPRPKQELGPGFLTSLAGWIVPFFSAPCLSFAGRTLVIASEPWAVIMSWCTISASGCPALINKIHLGPSNKITQKLHGD